MTRYFLRSCDRAGSVVHDACVEAPDVHAALAIANHRFRSMVRRDAAQALDPLERIDIADGQGHTVARLICSETIAAMS